MIQLIPLGMTLAQTLIPGLVREITGDKSAVVQQVAEIALQATGMTPETPAKDVTAALEANPEVYARVREAAAQVAMAELKAEVENQRTAAADMADARALYDRTSGIVQLAIAVGVFVGLFGMVTALFLVPLPDGSKEVVMLVMGGFLSAFTSLHAFYFGSSKGSKDKSAAMLSRPRG